MTKTRKSLSIFAITCFYMTTTSAHAMLAPLSLPQMYSYASRGDVRTLRLATQRGLNIDTTDRHGNTGLCYAILQNNIKAYNSFKAAGANPRHSCTYDIPTEQYNSFMARSGVYQETQTSREAYNYSNRGEYVISNKVWWIGGALLIGGGAALAFGGGGGGGGSSDNSNQFTPTNDSLSTFVGTKSTVDISATNGNASNLIDRTITNTATVDVDGTPTAVGDIIDFSGNILTETPLMRVAMKTFGEFVVENTTSAILTLNEAAAGLVADRPNAEAKNLGKIQITSKNATIGMIAGNSANATNEAGAEILMSFKGTNAKNQIIGMYADTLGTIENKGSIKTYSVNLSTAGKIIGMEGRLLNQEKTPSSSETTNVINATASTIDLSASGDLAATTYSTNLIGMGSFIDSDFLNGTKLIGRAGYVNIENNGNILLTYNLRNTALFDYGNNNIKKGSGIIGILADAHTNATNNGTIDVSVASEGVDTTDFQHAHAGMLATHGGNITNGSTGNIIIAGGQYGYGMASVRGSGANSEFDQLRSQLINNGTITINSLNGYGMASYYGGALTNNKTITLQQVGTGIYANYGTINNGSGALILLTESGNGILVSSENNAATALNTQINNQGEIRIEKATNATGIKTSNGIVNNNGAINLSNATATPSTISYGVYASKGTVNNRGTISINIANDTNTKSYGIYTEDADVSNISSGITSGKINLTHKGTGILSKNGKVTNELGEITLSNAGTAIETETGNITNNGSLTILEAKDSHGIKTNTGTVLNTNNISLKDVENSDGISSSTGNIRNSGIIDLDRGTDSIGITSTSGQIINTGSVRLTSVIGGFGINNETGATNNLGTIRIETSKDAIGIKSAGKVTNGSTDETTGSTASISVNGQDAIGVELASTSSGMDNYGKVIVSSGNTGEIYGIKSAGTTSVIRNHAKSEIFITGSSTIINLEGYGISSTDKEVHNAGEIKLTDILGYGIYSSSTTNIYNTGKITLNSGGVGILGTGGDIFNRSTGEITVGNSNTASYGIKAIGGLAQNEGKIYVQDVGSFGMYAENSAQLNNILNANIYLEANNSTGMSVSSAETNTGIATNYGAISSNGVARGDLVGMSAVAGGKIINNGEINLIATAGSNAIGMKVEGANAIASNRGNITLSGSGGTMYGIYASDESKVYNSGTISISNAAGTNYGIFAKNSTVRNSGTITINTDSTLPTCNTTDGCGNHIKLIDGATLENGGDFVTTSALNFSNFSDNTSSFSVAKGGSYIAPEISGTVFASSDIVEDGFDTTYVNENSFVGDDTGINLLSASYLFDANLVSNKEGSQDVVMTMKSFDEVIEDSSTADFLSQNYASQNGAEMFSLFKSANNQNSFGTAVNNQLGLDFFPSFARQNMEASKSLNRQINNSIFNNHSTGEVSGFVGYDYYKKHQEASGVVQGYKEDANSVYGVVEKKYNSEFSYGTGLSITQLHSKYDRGSKRDETIFNLYAPLKYQTNNFTFISTPRVGYGFGDYKRYSGTEFYSADTESFYYGIGNEVRKDIDLAILILEPTAEFNILGIKQAKTKENNQITVDSSNNLSIEGGLGLYAKKTFQFDEDNALKLRAGGTYYQEFNNAYSSSTAHMNGMSGQYHLKGYEAQRYRAVVSSRVEYQHKDVNFFGEASKLLEKDGSYEFNLGISLNF